MGLNTTEQENTRRIVLIESEGSLDAYTASRVRESALKRSRQTGGDVKLVWPSTENSRRILRLTHFDRVFDIAEDIDAAMARF